MKLWYELNEKNRIRNWTTIEHPFFDEIEIDDISQITETTGVVDGQLADIPLTEAELEKKREIANYARLDKLRRQRESECYNVINRGYFWYKKLTDTQLAELEQWYQEWLDVTDTLATPNKPEWL